MLYWGKFRRINRESSNFSRKCQVIIHGFLKATSGKRVWLHEDGGIGWGVECWMLNRGKGASFIGMVT